MIFRNNRWITRNSSNNEDSLQIAKEFNLSTTFSRIIENLGLEGKEEIKKFLYPKFTDLYDPFKLKGMNIIKKHIDKLIENKDFVCIYGDYDVDGITSVTILFNYFKSLKINVGYYIPNRFDEGYGLNIAAIKKLYENGVKTIVTVDCGISSVEEAKFAKSLGLELIITDHHKCPKELPDCLAIINPNQEDCNYPFKGLAGAGIAFKIVQAHSGEVFKEIYNDYIDIATIGTIADIAPITDENRIITKYGLEQISRSNNPGIKALIDVCGIEKYEINAGHIGFNIGPRLNAAGRVESANLGVELLTAYNSEECKIIADKLNDLNKERQYTEKTILNQCLEFIEKNSCDDDILVIDGKNWHTGVIGIVASKISEKFYKPVVILSVIDGLAKGSARSVGNFDIFCAMNHCINLFEKFGGHKMAAGLSMNPKNIVEFRKKINEYAKYNLNMEDKTPAIKINSEVFSKDIDYNLADELDLLKPFGFGNPKPLFIYKNLIVDSVRFIGKGKNHFKGIFHDKSRTYDSIKFNAGDIYKNLKFKDKIDLVFSIEKNNFRGVETIQFNIRDIFIKDYVDKDLKKEFMVSYINSILNNNLYFENINKSFQNESEIFIKLKSLIDDKKKINLYVGTIEALKKLENFFVDINFFNYEFGIGNLNFTKNINIILNPLKMDCENFFGSELLFFDINPILIENKKILNSSIFYTDEYLLQAKIISEKFNISRESYGRVYKSILNKSAANLNLNEISTEVSLEYIQVYFAIMVFYERKLVDISFENGSIYLKNVIKQSKKIDLFDSKLIKFIKNIR